MLFVGDDWAEDHHDVQIQDESGRRLRAPAAPGLAILIGSGAVASGSLRRPRLEPVRIHQAADDERVVRHGLLGSVYCLGAKRDQTAGPVLEWPSEIVLQTELAPVRHVVRDRLGDALCVGAHEVEEGVVTAHHP